MKHLYGEFTENQIAQTKKSLRGSIFFLLLCVDPQTSSEYENVDIIKCFEGLMLRMGGMNELLMNQPEVVTTMSLLQAALMEYRKIGCITTDNLESTIKNSFDFQVYRKLILDAGAEIQKLKEV